MELTKEEIDDLNDIELEKYNKTNYFDKMYDCMIYFVYSICSFFHLFISVAGIYIVWICIHYFSAHLYTYYCVPNTLVGFFMSPFMMVTPHCQGLRWVIFSAPSIINNMWLCIGSHIYSLLWIVGGVKL